MSTFGTAVQTSAAAAGAAYATFHTGAGRRAFLREIGMFTLTATPTQVGVVYPNNTPVATTSTTPVAHDVADAAPTCALDVAWSTAPTVAGSPNWLRQVNLGPAIGAGVVWKLALDERIILAKSQYLSFWNFGASAASALNIYVEYDE